MKRDGWWVDLRECAMVGSMAVSWVRTMASWWVVMWVVWTVTQTVATWVDWTVV